MDPINLYYSLFLNQSGYSQAAQDIVLSLDSSKKYNIKLDPFGGSPPKAVMSDKTYALFDKMTKLDIPPDAIQILHCIPILQKKKKKMRRNIAFATFETFDPPEYWMNILNENDGIIAPSLFNYRIFSHMKIKKPIFYIPHCFNIDKFNLLVVPLEKRKLFTFLFMGTWKKRKGYEQLIEAWLNEFDDKDGVQLLIKTDKVQSAHTYVEKIKKQLGKTKGIAPILFESKIYNEIDLPRFLKSCDCLINPSRGEGFGIPGLQCMAVGVPVIITDFSGCQDYAKIDTAILLEPRGFTLCKDMDSIPQFRNKKWAFIAVEDIRKAMRYVINNNREIQQKTQNAYQFVRDNFNYQKIENMFYKMLGSLYGI